MAGRPAVTNKQERQGFKAKVVPDVQKKKEKEEEEKGE